jgi:hypothetical protein
MRKAMVLGVLALAGTLASPAFADEFSGFRLGVLTSQDKLEGDFTFTPAGTQPINSNRFGFGLFGGWALNRYLAVEVGLRSGGSFSDSAFPAFQQSISTLPPTPTPPAVAPPDSAPFFKVRNDLLSFETSVVGSWWITNKFSLFGRAGFYGWKSETSYSFGDLDAGPAIRDAADDTGFAPLFGLGVQTQLDGALIRLEYQMADVGDLSFGNNFGQTENTVSSLAVSIVWIL